MARRDRYSLALLRADYTYSVQEVADLYRITPDTVFRWIRDEGLNRIPLSKKYFVHSSDLRRFIEGLNRRNKKPCGDDEAYCCKCRRPRKPAIGSLVPEVLPNRSVRVKGKCGVCATGLNKVVSGKDWSESHPLHPDRNAPAIEHNGANAWPRKFQTYGGDD